MCYVSILKNINFNNLAAIVRVANDPEWKSSHPSIPLANLLSEFYQTIRTEQLNIGNIINTFTKLFSSIVAVNDRLSYSENDMSWFLSLCDKPEQEIKLVLHMLVCWWTAEDTLLTPSEVAQQTNTSESSWRNKAASGEIPGAIKKGKQWLLPASVLRSRGIKVKYENSNQA